MKVPVSSDSQDVSRPTNVSGHNQIVNRESHGLAETFDPGISLDRRQEARPQDRVHEDRGRRFTYPDQEVASSD
jgi:hypothetical protein